MSRFSLFENTGGGIEYDSQKTFPMSQCCWNYNFICNQLALNIILDTVRYLQLKTQSSNMNKWVFCLRNYAVSLVLRERKLDDGLIKSVLEFKRIHRNINRSTTVSTTFFLCFLVFETLSSCVLEVQVGTLSPRSSSTSL